MAGGILAAPLLCDAGVTEHECVCDSEECCADETSCELDPCEVVYERKDPREQAPPSAGVLLPILIGVDASPASTYQAVTSFQDTRVDRPFPDSDLPLRI